MLLFQKAEKESTHGELVNQWGSLSTQEVSHGIPVFNGFERVNKLVLQNFGGFLSCLGIYHLQSCWQITLLGLLLTLLKLQQTVHLRIIFFYVEILRFLLVRKSKKKGHSRISEEKNDENFGLGLFYLIHFSKKERDICLFQFLHSNLLCFLISKTLPI